MSAAREAIVRCCRRLWEAGLIAGAGGNVSVRIGRDALLVTPSGVLKSDLVQADLVKVGLGGECLGGFRKATSELDLHLRVYAGRPEVGAVVHAHPHPRPLGWQWPGKAFRPMSCRR